MWDHWCGMGGESTRGRDSDSLRHAPAPPARAETQTSAATAEAARAIVASDARLLQPRHLAALQRSAGNGATAAVVQRALSVQRWTVPGSLPCEEVVPYMDGNSPHAPEWAATQSTHSFGGQVRVRHDTKSDGTVESSARGHPGVQVTVASPVDRPEWNPTPRPNRAAEVSAWRAMRVSLDAHERQHQRIGQTNNAELLRRYRAVNLTVTGSDAQANTAELTSQLQAQQESWAAWAQAEQDAIDPFRGANLACPPAAADAETED